VISNTNEAEDGWIEEKPLLVARLLWQHLNGIDLQGI
jgi:hypothetical protein